jgi:hypothetical protein
MNPAIQGTFTVMHVSTAADFDNFVYGAYVIINNPASVTINGTTFAPQNEWDGQVIPLLIDGATTTPDANIMLLGNPIAPQTEVKTGLISATTETFQNNTGRVDTYQYVDIKTGNPIRS